MVENFVFNEMYLKDSTKYVGYIELLFVSKFDLSKHLFFDGIEFKLIEEEMLVDLNLWEDITSITKALNQENMNISSIKEDEFGDSLIELNEVATLKIVLKLDYREEIMQQVFLEIR